ALHGVLDRLRCAHPGGATGYEPLKILALESRNHLGIALVVFGSRRVPVGSSRDEPLHVGINQWPSRVVCFTIGRRTVHMEGGHPLALACMSCGTVGLAIGLQERPHHCSTEGNGHEMMAAETGLIKRLLSGQRCDPEGRVRLLYWAWQRGDVVEV